MTDVSHPAGLYPDGSRREYTYDTAGQILSMSDPLGATTYEYDEYRRPAAVTDSFGNTIGYRWDPAGNLTNLIYPDGRAVAYEYDVLRRLTAVRDWVGGATSYSYDDFDRVTRVARPGGLESAYRYDTAGRLAGLQHLAPGGTELAAYAYTYDARGDIAAITELDGKTTAYAYDPAGRLLQATETEACDRHSWQYAYDAVGNIQSIFELEGDPEEPVEATRADLEYDLASQLVRAVLTGSPGETEETSYAYDARGNLVREERLESGAGETDDVETGAVPLAGKASHAGGNGKGKGNGQGGGGGQGNGAGGGSDNDQAGGNGPGGSHRGNPQGGRGNRKAVTTYRYDYDNHLIEVSQGDGTDNGVGRCVRFTYDGNGNKVALEAWVDVPGNGNHYGWEKDNGKTPGGDNHGGSNPGGKNPTKPISELTLAFQYVVDSVTGTPRVLETEEGGGPQNAYLYGLDRLAAFDSADAPSYFLPDHAGSVRQIASPDGRVLERYSYSPYGLPRGGSLDPGSRINTGNLFGFTGAEHDPVFDLLALGARTYSPDLARFLSSDPLLTLGGSPLAGNPYAYAAGNPVRYADPTGLIEEQLGLNQYATPGEMLFWNVVETVGMAAGAMLVILAAPVAAGFGIAALAVGATLTTSHLIGVTEDWSAYLRGDYGSIGGNDPIYGYAAEHLGSAGTLVLGIAEGLFWAKFPAMTGMELPKGVGGAGAEGSSAGTKRIGWTGEIGQQALAEMGGVPKSYLTPYGWRYVDGLTADGIAHEAKVGYQYLSSAIRAEIAKDSWLLSEGAVRGSVWDFYRSPVTGAIGPSGPLRQALEQAGLESIIHWGTP